MTIDSQPTIIIVDSDAGLDDAWALLLLISAQKKLNFEIAGITCVSGNTTVENVCINILRILDAAKCLKNIPVFKGSSTPLILPNEYTPPHSHYHGIDGFGDTNFEKKGEVSLLCLGPLTNIALAIRTFPTFQHNVKDIYFMGGNYQGVGNTSNSAEFNFSIDPEAAHIVLSSAIKVKVMLPWETCATIEFPMDWRDNILGKSDNFAIRLMNKAEQIFHKRSSPVWRPADEVIAAYLINKSVAIQLITLCLTVELHGMLTRGQVVVCHHKSKEEAKVHVITGINKKELERLLLDIHNLP